MRLGLGEELLGVSGLGMLGGMGWGIDAWPVVGMLDGGSPADECGFSVFWSFPYTYRIPSVLVFPTPIRPIFSLPYFPYPLFPTITTLMHPRPDAESCCSISHLVAGCLFFP